MSFPAYDMYQDSGVEWIGALPCHWKTSRLAFEADVLAGYPFNASLFGFDGIPVIRMSNFGNGRVDTEDAERVAEEHVPDSSLAQSGDVLLGLSGSISNFGIVAESDLPIAINQRVAVVRAERSNRELILWFLQSPEFLNQLVADLPSTTILNISMGDLCKCRIPVPPEDEQKAISSFLDVETSKIDGLVSEQRRLIELLKEKRQAVISHAVTKGLNPNAPMKPSGIQWLGDVPQHWEMKKLGWVLRESPKNGASPQINADGQTPTFSIAAVRNGTTNIRDHIKYADISLEDAAPYFVQKNDILVLRGNGSKALVGTAGIVADVPPENCIYPDILIRIRPSERLLPWYLVTVLNSSSIRPSVEMAAQTASGVWKISGKSLQDLRLPVPPTDEQTAIQAECVQRTSELDTLLAEAERAIELLQERRTALISAAVTGKIDVREFADQETA